MEMMGENIHGVDMSLVSGGVQKCDGVGGIRRDEVGNASVYDKSEFKRRREVT